LNPEIDKALRYWYFETPGKAPNNRAISAGIATRRKMNRTFNNSAC